MRRHIVPSRLLVALCLVAMATPAWAGGGGGGGGVRQASIPWLPQSLFAALQVGVVCHALWRSRR